MKFLITTLLGVAFFSLSYGQIINESGIAKRYYKLLEGSENSHLFRVELFSAIDSSWNKWQHRGYHFGFDPRLTPMYTTIDGIISTPYMVQVRGNANERNKKRWGYHVFEGYAKDDKSRITMLVNKHLELGKPVAEMYYYGTEYNHSNVAYNWFRIGSDVRQHSYLFSRDQAIFYGSLTLSNALTLGRISNDKLRKEKPEGDDEKNFEESAKHVNYKELKESGDGTIFYDEENDIVVIKVKGKWMKVKVQPLPNDVQYDF
ncbi:MAG: hypothetical protein H7X84_06365 [Verrucomicrobia bacterium]|nr:hypothetical protein [Prolixibacteraceae bacterium]